MLPQELFEVQGWPIFAPDFPYGCPFRHKLLDVSQDEEGEAVFVYKLIEVPDLRGMAGNGMSLPCVGYVLLFLLCGTTLDELWK